MSNKLYQLWIGDMKGGIAIEDDARNWLAGMHEHGYQDVRIEPTSDGRVTFPVPKKTPTPAT